MFFKKGVKKQAGKVDKLITGIIIGGAVAGAVGISRTSKGKKFIHNFTTGISNLFGKSKSIFGKCLVAMIKIFKRK